MIDFGTRQVVFGLALLVSTTAHAQLVVTSCGATLMDGVLAGDLDCSDSVNGVTILDGGSFDLAGFTLVPGSKAGVSCAGDCTIEGSGGRITGGVFCGIMGSGDNNAVVTVRNLEVSNNDLDGIWSNGADVSNCNVFGNGRAGILAWERDIASTDNTISSNSIGIASRRRAVVTGSTITNNSWGVAADRRVTLSGSSVESNLNVGVRSWVVTVGSSDIIDNGIVCTEAPYCYDVASKRRPRFEPLTVTCFESARIDAQTFQPTGEDWDVCSGD